MNDVSNKTAESDRAELTLEDLLSRDETILN